MKHLACDIAIIGASTGGIAASMAVLDAGYKVILTESSNWLGGQLTSQGVSALDEHQHIEHFGGTKSYYDLRTRIRRHYELKYDKDVKNPGNGWVSRLCFEPEVAEQIFREKLKPYILSGQLTILYGTVAKSAEMHNCSIQTVTLKSGTELYQLEASYFLDATDLGDLLPLSQTAYVSGAEGKEVTGEPHAGQSDNEEVQSFTYGFVLEHCPGENHTIKKPKNYNFNRDTQPYTLEHYGDKQYKMFQSGDKGEKPFWTYRRLFEAQQFNDPDKPNDLALINWPGNDFRFGNIIDKPEYQQKRMLSDAKNLSLGFLYWLQTECPRDDGGFGYPEFKFRKDIMGSRNGLSRQPYIRESRRIKSLETICAQDISQRPVGARARSFNNSVGLGWYSMDLHRSGEGEDLSMFKATSPFQIPLGSLIPIDTKNLIAACKNIGTTHLTNGAYRVHPVEWSIGEAAGQLAAFCLTEKRKPHQVWQDEKLTRTLQKSLFRRGCPIAWGIDVPLEHPFFKSAQIFALEAISEESFRFKTLELALDKGLSKNEQALFTQALAEFDIRGTQLAGSLEEQLSVIEPAV